MSENANDDPVIIVGGGLSGLAAAWQLHRHQVDVRLVEARNRLGGRVKSPAVGDGFFDIGPSWVWPGQPCVAFLLKHFGIDTYQQICDGDLVHQSDSGRVIRNAMLKPMQGALRIDGGVAALVNAMAAEIPADRIALESPVSAIKATDSRVQVAVPQGVWSASNVAVAVPLRLAAGVDFDPPLDSLAIQQLARTQTWMAAHAKFFSFYDRPFWRDRGLSGDAFSQCGPLAEVHDASPRQGGPYALMGFFGIDHRTRISIASELVDRTLRQLGDMFGEEARNPTHHLLQDWADEPYTASPADRVAPDHHPQYGVSIRPGQAWDGRVEFIVSETSPVNGGLIEGALHQGFLFAKSMIDQRSAAWREPSQDQAPEHRAASMSWDWLSS